MSEKLVAIQGACISCPKSVSPGGKGGFANKLTGTSDPETCATNETILTENDSLVGTHIFPFLGCTLTPTGSCTPVPKIAAYSYFASPWKNTVESFADIEERILTEGSYFECIYGNTKVTINKAGQNSLTVQDLLLGLCAFSDDVQALAYLSPTLSEKLKALVDAGWTIEYGTAGGGSYADRTSKSIVIDENLKGNDSSVVQVLAHEAGHATYTPDPYVGPDGLTRAEYVDANLNNNLKDEGEATLVNIEVRDEIVANGGSDIGIAGTQDTDYENAHNDYANNHGDRDRTRQEIGNLFADGETTSTTGESYRDYYSQPYEDWWDTNVGTP